MARPLRIEYPGAVYHVTGRGNDKKAIFRTDADRMAFLDTLLAISWRRAVMSSSIRCGQRWQSIPKSGPGAAMKQRPV